MNCFPYIEKIPVAFNNDSEPDSVAFDGCNYYFLFSCSKEVIKTSLTFKTLECFKLDDKYNNICFDFKDRCFLATSPKCCNKIFKLSCEFVEFDSMCLKCTDNIDGAITGISYNCDHDSILISFNNVIARVNKETGEVSIRFRGNNISIIDVLSVSPGVIALGVKEGKQCVLILDSKYKIINSEFLDYKYTVKNIIFNPCTEKCGCVFFDLLAIKSGCYPYIIKVKTNLSELGFTPLPCNFEVCTKKFCCDCDDEKPCKKRNPCCDILESIALVEAAISHILNAEGEKLEKVLATTDDIDTILCVNREVNKVIINATHLEHTLYDKLSLLCDLGICNECCGCEGNCGCSCGSDCQDDCDDNKIDFKDLNLDLKDIGL